MSSRKQRPPRPRLETIVEGEPPDQDRAPATVRAPHPEPVAEEDTVTEKVTASPSEPVRDRATLTQLTGLHAGRVFELGAVKTVVGRSADAEITIDDGGVSRKHARIIRWVGMAYVVEDLDSMNGTYVNGRRVERAPIASGDRLQLGPSAQLRFALTDATESQLQAKLYDAVERDLSVDVYTKKHLMRQLRLEIAYARRHGASVSLALVRLEGLKNHVRVHGSEGGAQLFQKLGQHIAESGRIEDLVARWDEDSFAALLRTTSLEDAVAYARQICERSAPLLADREPALQLRIGVSATEELAMTAEWDELAKLGVQRVAHASQHAADPICTHTIAGPPSMV